MSAPPPPSSSPPSTSDDDNNNNVENAIAFLNHPSVKNVSSSKEKKQFLRNKNLTDAEISEAFERVGLVFFDEENDEDGEEEKSSSRSSFLTPTTTRPPPAVPRGVIQKHAANYYGGGGGGGLRWTQVVAYACALGMFGSYAYPKLKRCVSEYYSSSTRRREEEEAKKQAQLMRAISQSVTENLAEFEKKLKTRQETTESAVLQSVQNVEEKLREELRMVKMTHVEDAMDERERSKEDMREVKKSLMEAVEEERKEMEALRRSVLKEMELAREKMNNNIKAETKEEKEEGESPSRRLGEKGYVAERVEAVENNKNNEDLDLDDYFQAKKRHQMELLGGEDDDDDDYADDDNNNINNGPRGSSNLQQQQQQQQQRAANVRKNMGTNQNQPQQRRVLEEPPRPKNFLEVIELVEKGEPVPGIKDIDDRPPNPDVALPPVSEDFEERTRKPWSMKPSDDASFEGHRPWDKYGNGAAASGEYSFDGGSGGFWTPPVVPSMSDSARQAYGL